MPRRAARQTTPTAAAARKVTGAWWPFISHQALDAATELYQRLRARAHSDGVRLTAQITGQVAKAVLKRAGQQAEEVEFTRVAQQLITSEALRTLAECTATGTPGSRNFAEHHDQVTASTGEGESQRVVTAGTEVGEASTEVAGAVALFAAENVSGFGTASRPADGGAWSPVAPYRDILDLVQAIEQLTGSPCLQLNVAEEAEFDQLHLRITARLAAILRSIAPSG